MLFNENEMNTLRDLINHQPLLRPVGIGIATENKLISTHECYFQIIEWFPLDQGEMKSDTMEIKDSGIDAKGEAYEVTVKFSKSILAKWLPNGGNKISSPDIRRGEKVEIVRLGDSNEYYWRPLELNQGVRRKETVMQLFSNTDDEKVKELSAVNSWAMEISTHQKTMSLSTPKNDNEEFAYDMQLNTKDSTFVLKDDSGNSFELESKEKRWRIVNSAGTEIIINGKDMTITVPGTYMVRAGKIELHSSGSSNFKFGGSFTMTYNGATIKGNTMFRGKLFNNGVNVGSTHRHGGVKGGPSLTSSPL